MNVLVVCHYGLYQNFSFSFVHAQAAAYAALGHQVRVIVPIAIGKRDWDRKRFSGPIRRLDRDGVEIYAMRYLSLSKYGEGHFNTVSAIVAIRLHLRTILDGFIPDAIHAHTLGFDSGIGAWLKGRLNIPLVVTTHGGDAFVPYAKGDYSQLKGFADQADHLVCVSSLLMRRMQECGVEVPVSVILNGFHVKGVTSNPVKLPMSIAQAGYLIARKKADVTIRAFAALLEHHSEASLDIIGSGTEMKRFQDLCTELGVSNSVRFHGFLPNPQLLEQLASACFFVMPSVDEGFGIVYLEAMACGCITIGTKGEGIADLIVSGENGFLVPPDDPEAIVQIIEWCLEHPDESAAIAERGRREALCLTWEKNAGQYIDLFEELIL